MKHTIKQFGCSIGLNGPDKIFYEDCKLQTGLFKTTKKFILKRCTWYYEYEDLFSDYPGINPLTFIKSKQPIYCNRQVINGFEIGKYDQDLECGSKGLKNFHPNEENDEDDFNSSNLHSFLSQIA